MLIVLLWCGWVSLLSSICFCSPDGPVIDFWKSGYSNESIDLVQELQFYWILEVLFTSSCLTGLSYTFAHHLNFNCKQCRILPKHSLLDLLLSQLWQTFHGSSLHCCEARRIVIQRLRGISISVLFSLVTQDRERAREDRREQSLLEYEAVSIFDIYSCCPFFFPLKVL